MVMISDMQIKKEESRLESSSIDFSSNDNNVMMDSSTTNNNAITILYGNDDDDNNNEKPCDEIQKSGNNSMNIIIDNFNNTTSNNDNNNNYARSLSRKTSCDDIMSVMSSGDVSLLSQKSYHKINSCTKSLRQSLSLLFFGIIVAVASVVFVVCKSQQNKNFETEFHALADKVLESFEFNLGNTLSSISSMSITATSTAMNSNVTWPFFTMVDYSYLGGSALSLSGAYTVELHMVVTHDLKDEWEAYAEQNIGWYWHSLEIEESGILRHHGDHSNHHHKHNHDHMQDTSYADDHHRRLHHPADFPNGYSNRLYRHEDGFGLILEDHQNELFLPTWQVMPLTPKSINFNQLSRPIVDKAILQSINNREVVLSNLPTSGDEFYNSLFADTARAEEYPLANLYYPVFDKLQDLSSNTVAMLSMTISWQRVLSYILPENSKKIVAVIKNTCGQALTYSIMGDEALFLGEGDLHQIDIRKGEKKLEFADISHSQCSSSRGATEALLSREHCPFSLHIYPSEGMRKAYYTAEPLIYAALTVIALIFIFAVAAFYDWLIHRRLQNLIQESKVSDAIVASILPKITRERLLGRNMLAANYQQKHRQRPQQQQQQQQQFHYTKQTSMIIRSVLQKNISTSNLNSDSYRSDGSKNSFDIQQQQLTPLADLYPRCTVMFAYIHGFDEWSIGRAPQDILILLESIFLKMDELARKYSVFKVESIGNSYLAVAGLPEEQPDHTVRMVGYARACVTSIKKVSQNMTQILGNDTAKLQLKVGLHSGQVTAGLLGGQMIRFQVFGDCVNTASRIASSSHVNKVQLSEASAKLLVEFGKGDWIEEREYSVHLKGKGDIKTYWLIDH